MFVGLTGGIACGKSTVARMFIEGGCKIVDADHIARQVVLPGQPALDQVVMAFGQHILHQDGSLNRQKLGQLVFGDESLRRLIESILHPAIRTEMQRQMHVLAEEDPSAMIILDIPLLYESGSQRVLPIEEVIVVYIPRHMQLLRLMGRDGLSQEEAEKRIHAQMSIEDKRKLADIVIDNSGTPNETWLQVQSYLKKKGKL